MPVENDAECKWLQGLDVLDVLVVNNTGSNTWSSSSSDCSRCTSSCASYSSHAGLLDDGGDNTGNTNWSNSCSACSRWSSSSPDGDGDGDGDGNGCAVCLIMMWLYFFFLRHLLVLFFFSISIESPRYICGELASCASVDLYTSACRGKGSWSSLMIHDTCTKVQSVICSVRVSVSLWCWLLVGCWYILYSEHEEQSVVRWSWLEKGEFVHILCTCLLCKIYGTCVRHTFTFVTTSATQCMFLSVNTTSYTNSKYSRVTMNIMMHVLIHLW